MFNIQILNLQYLSNQIVNFQILSFQYLASQILNIQILTFQNLASQTLKFQISNFQYWASKFWNFNILLGKPNVTFSMLDRQIVNFEIFSFYYWILEFGIFNIWQTKSWISNFSFSIFGKPNLKRSHWLLDLFAKSAFLDILVIFRLDLGQITFNQVENAFATQQLAFLATSIVF